MRIRKRQAVVVEPTRPTRLLLAVSSGNDNEHFAGQNSCTCCSRQRRLRNWEFRNEFERETDVSVNRFDGGISLVDKNQVSACNTQTAEYGRTEMQLSEPDKFEGRSGKTPTQDFRHSEITDGEQKGSLVATTLESLGGFDRVRNNEHSIKATGSRVSLYVNGQFHGSGDVNHPGNKPKESLLYSLYCVFSKLSGKAVLTAREALSRIIEERLPGLDEEIGLPSLQVAKVMRSNPYFVHLEGGKFFLCSAPILETNDDAETGDALDCNGYAPGSASPSLQPTLRLLNSLSKAESSKGEKQQQPFSNTEAVRTKRTRSKEVATIGSCVGNGPFEKTNGRSRGSKREGQKSLKLQNSTSDQGRNGDQPGEPICKRYDGRGWKCKEKALPGYSMCRHHHELIVNRLARLRSSGRLVSKKLPRGGKPVLSH